ncbi:LysR family transcriptional regulator [Citreicella sp. C3M06]|uniref:LysR family transcriptional regulator n=1 Tax=Citreicella sp. C3M06 TaxID=2841564 RepID=UPI001C086205|nr:LysR family transcriptional regulator [Citreicella sp. C3M06]MBU2960248.1 LysR family transcriptional regulator [Citreicella sp. C3M06]
MEEIARLGSIRRAAEVLNVSASAIDKQLLRAEQDLGVPLFERHPRGVRLTSAGELLMYRMRGWRRDMRAVSAEIEELKGLSRGEVRIAAPQDAASGLLPRALAAFRAAHPKITLSLRVSGSDNVRQRVIDGEADLGLTFSPRPLPGVSVLREVPFRVLALLPSDGRARQSVSLGRFFSKPVLLPGAGSPLRDIHDIAAARAGVEPLAAITADSTEVLRALVREGCGHGLIAVCAGLPERPEPGLDEIPLRGPALPPLSLALIAPRDTSSSLAAVLARRHFEVFMDRLRG